MSLVINQQAYETLANDETGAYYALLNSNTGKVDTGAGMNFGSTVSPSSNYYTCSRFGTANTAFLTSAAVSLVPITLPVGLIVTKIGFVSATTAAS